MSEVFRLQLVERPGQMVEARVIGYAHATVPLPYGLEEVAGLLADGEYARLGQALYGVLFPEGEVRDALAEALVVTRAERRPLTVQLHLDGDSPDLARYPWELIHDGQSFLVADGVVALARYIDYAQALIPLNVQTPLRVLLVAPRPADLAELEEQPPVAVGALEDLCKKGVLQVDVLSPPTFEALRQVLSGEAYQVLHFTGASGLDPRGGGAGRECLFFEDECGAASPLGGAELHNALFLSKVRLAVLTPPDPGQRAGPTALGGLAPALIRAGVPAVVAMQHSLEAEQSERFVRQLYHSLANLTPLGTAVAYARGQLLPPESTRFAPAVYLQDKEGTGELFIGAGKAEPAPLGYVPAGRGRISAGYRADEVFIDRAQMVIQTLQALRGPGRYVCLWGLGGVGKTAVAREVVRRATWRFPGGTIWLGLQGGRSLAAILAEIAGFYGPARLSPRLDDAARQVTTLLAEQASLAGGEILLVLDNFEDVAADPDLKGFLATLPPAVRVLATSRAEPAPADWRALEVRAMAAEDIERILRRKIEVQRIPVSPADEPLLAEISGLLDGYPLGVDLVVSLARTCSWAHIRDELRAQPPPPLQAILRATINEGLSDADRRLGARLSVLRGPFDEAAIARVAGTPQWLPHVQRLRERALLSFDGTTYAFDVPVREHLYALLEPEEARSCHEQAYRYFASRRDPDSLVEAFQQAMAAGHYGAARTLLADRLTEALLDAGRYRQLLGLLDAALAAPEAFDERFLLSRATVLRTLGRLPEALASLEQLLQVPDLTVPNRALALHEQGRIFYELDDEERGDHERALECYAEAMAICDDLAAAEGHERSRRRWLDREMATLFQDVAIVYQYALARPEDLAFARQLYEASAGLWQRLRDPVSRAISEKQRADILRRGTTADRAEAKRVYRQVMQAFRRKGLERLYGETLLQLGKIYLGERALKHALKRFQEYEEIQRRLGLEREEAMAWKHQGEIYQEAGYRGRSVKQAVELYTRALERLTRFSDRWSRRTVVSALLRRGEAYLELRLPRQASQDFREALARSVAMGTRNEEFDVARLSESDRQRLAWAFCALTHTTEGEESEEARDYLEPAQATYRSLGVATGEELDCRRALEITAWVRHHDARRKT